MQEFYNGSNYEELTTVHELDYNGQNVHRAFGDNSIKIYGCSISVSPSFYPTISS